MNSLFKTVTCHSQDRGTRPSQSPISQTGLPQSAYQVLIEDLEVDMFIGVLDQEKEQKQKVLVSLVIDVRNTFPAKGDNIESVVSYADVIEFIKEIAAQGHINLVETFAQEIIDKCFDDLRVQQVSVTVKKPDIIGQAGAVGVCLSQSR